MRMTVLIAAVAALALTSAHAQDAGNTGGVGLGGAGGRHHGQQQKTAKAAPKPKADEKAYGAALKAIPDKPYDPWHGVH